MSMRSLRHPGPALEPRVLAETCSARRLTLRFKPGKPVLDAVAEALAAVDCDSAVLEFTGGGLAPLVYVIPAASPDNSHAAWYSDTRRPEGIARFEHAVMSFGRRNGAPFIHCHGTWLHEDGFRGAGHLIPNETMFANEVEATVYAISGAILDQQHDPETNFPLLTPVPNGIAKDGQAAAVLLRIKPNTCVDTALENYARSQGFGDATIHGIGSLVGCDFTDGSHMPSYASEFYVRRGYIKDSIATIDIGVVGIDTIIYDGVISNGVNVICIACELLIIKDKMSPM